MEKHPVFNVLHTLQYGKIGNCQACKLALTRTHIVFGGGNPLAEVVLVGEGPGAEEDKRGEVFCGPSGILLTRALETVGLDRRTVYILNSVLCRACDVMDSGWVKNRQPQEDELRACFSFFNKHLEALPNKKLVISFGGTAAHRVMLQDQGKYAMWKLRKKVIATHYGPLVCTYHPSYLLRSPEEKAKTYEDLKFAMRFLHHPDPDNDPEFEQVSPHSAGDRRDMLYRQLDDKRVIGKPRDDQRDNYAPGLEGI